MSITPYMHYSYVHYFINPSRIPTLRYDTRNYLKIPNASKDNLRINHIHMHVNVYKYIHVSIHIYDT